MYIYIYTYSICPNIFPFKTSLPELLGSNNIYIHTRVVCSYIWMCEWFIFTKGYWCSKHSQLVGPLQHYIKVLFLCIIRNLNQTQAEIIETGIRRKWEMNLEFTERVLPLCQQDFIFKVMAEHLADFWEVRPKWQITLPSSETCAFGRWWLSLPASCLFFWW